MLSEPSFTLRKTLAQWKWIYPSEEKLGTAGLGYIITWLSFIVLINYFIWQGVCSKSQKQSPEDPEKYTCFALFAKFGKEVILTWCIQCYHRLFKNEHMLVKKS